MESNKKYTLDLSDLARAGHVTRWHSVRTLREQTLAEHHYMVAMIANKLAKNILGANITDSDRVQLLEYALWHDMPEIIMGDISSPCKRKIQQLCNGQKNPIAELEDEIAPWLKKIKNNLKPELVVIAKLSDLMDAIIFIAQEGVGRHAETVKNELLKSFEGKISGALKSMAGYNWSIASDVLDRLLSEDKQVYFELTE